MNSRTPRGKPLMPSEAWIISALQRHEAPLLRYAAWLLRDADRARDVVQEAFLRLCQQERTSVEDRLPQWLFTVCRNLVVDLRRRDVSAGGLADPAGISTRQVDDALATLERQALLGEILRLVDALPVNQREVVYLRFQGGFSYKEISALTGLSVGNVGFLIHSAMHRIRRRVRTESAATVKEQP
jgi:RNA polymerase sigma-70 factor (ECF subfamily)